MFCFSHVFIPCVGTDKLSPSDKPEFLYFINEGVYGSFSHKLLGGTIPAPAVYKVSRPPLQRPSPIL